jgi:DNA-binding NtrC family response regulator
MYSPVSKSPNRDRTGAILAISLPMSDQRELVTLFEQLPWELRRAATLQESIRDAMSGTVPVVICEAESPGGNWRTLLDRISVLARPPRLIVASRLADDRLWAEVLNLGGYDVLATPFVPEEVQRVLWYAVDSWGRQDRQVWRKAGRGRAAGAMSKIQALTVPPTNLTGADIPRRG